MIRRTLVVLVLLALSAMPVFANHAWSTYHWSTVSYPMNIKVGNNMTSVWQPYFNEAITDWNKSTKLALQIVAGGSNKRCAATAGRIEVCNGTYGQNGWLGLGSIWLSGGHISQATAKMNDTYYAFSQYNTPGWRDLVTCQEIGHDFGLGHQDENNNNTNLGSCMDYTAYPDGGGTGGSLSNRAPNAHDYAQLDTIYSHTHGSNSYSSTYEIITDSINRAGNQMPLFDENEITEPWQWGTPVRWNAQGQAITYVREIDTDHGDEHELGGGRKIVTHVFWAPFPVDSFEGQTPGRDRMK